MKNTVREAISLVTLMGGGLAIAFGLSKGEHNKDEIKSLAAQKTALMEQMRKDLPPSDQAQLNALDEETNQLEKADEPKDIIGIKIATGGIAFMAAGAAVRFLPQRKKAQSPQR
jgi:hypothetical protein